ncbi:hypothetical protein HDU85_002296 [Gaertneriomyces sp. JEL0708]|nr:hypothetical protein HDU85_002296 [Gaertneriomyces sp. JEL0708]
MSDWPTVLDISSFLRENPGVPWSTYCHYLDATLKTAPPDTRSRNYQRLAGKIQKLRASKRQYQGMKRAAKIQCSKQYEINQKIIEVHGKTCETQHLLIERVTKRPRLQSEHDHTPRENTDSNPFVTVTDDPDSNPFVTGTDDSYDGFDYADLDKLFAMLEDIYYPEWMINGTNLTEQFRLFQLDSIDLARSQAPCFKDHLHEILALHSVFLADRSSTPVFAPNVELVAWQKEWDEKYPQPSLQLPDVALTILHEYNQCIMDANGDRFRQSWINNWALVAQSSRGDQDVLTAIQIVSRAIGLSLLSGNIPKDEDTFAHTYLHELLTETLRDPRLTISWANGESGASRVRRCMGDEVEKNRISVRTYWTPLMKNMDGRRFYSVKQNHLRSKAPPKSTS